MLPAHMVAAEDSHLQRAQLERLTPMDPGDPCCHHCGTALDRTSITTTTCDTTIAQLSSPTCASCCAHGNGPESCDECPHLLAMRRTA